MSPASVVPFLCFQIRHFVLVAMILQGAVIASAQELVTNGGFTSGGLGLLGWTQMPGATYSAGSNPADSSPAIRISNRPGTTVTLRQNLTAALSPMGSGTTLSLRFWISCDSMAQVRGTIGLLDSASSASRTVIMAETMVLQGGGWQEVRGSWPVRWQGTLTQAVLTFEVGNALEPVGAAPNLTLDQVSLQADPDGDTLVASEESQAGTNPILADTDGDSVPDRIEIRAGMNPTVSDGTTDSDGDGSSNVVEAWAGSLPFDQDSIPGAPCTVGATARTRAVARILAELPGKAGNNRVAVGQHISFPDAPELEYEAYVRPLQTTLGDLPAVLALQYENSSSTPTLFVPTVNRLAYEHWQAGGLVEIKFNPTNPWTGFSSSTPNHGPVDLAELTTTGSASNLRFLEELGRVADGLEVLQTSGVVVLYRTCAEQNAPHFWWGRRPRAQFVAFWTMMHDFLTRQRGLKNLLFVFESDMSPHPITAIDYYYPGPETVDVLGHNFYTDSWIPTIAVNDLLWKYGKIYAIPQAGPVVKANTPWDNRIFLTGGDGVSGIRGSLPRLAYFAAWNSWVTGNGDRFRMAIIDNQNASQLWADPWAMTLSDVPSLVEPSTAAQSWMLYE